MTPRAAEVEARLKHIVRAATDQGRTELNHAERAEVQALLDTLEPSEVLTLLARRDIG